MGKKKKKAFSCSLRTSLLFSRAWECLRQPADLVSTATNISLRSFGRGGQAERLLGLIHKGATFLINPDLLLLFNCVFVFVWMQENRDFRSPSTKKPNSATCRRLTSAVDAVLQDSACVTTGDPPAGKQWRVCIVMTEWGRQCRHHNNRSLLLCAGAASAWKRSGLTAPLNPTFDQATSKNKRPQTLKQTHMKKKTRLITVVSNHNGSTHKASVRSVHFWFLFPTSERAALNYRSCDSRMASSWHRRPAIWRQTPRPPTPLPDWTLGNI